MGLSGANLYANFQLHFILLDYTLSQDPHLEVHSVAESPEVFGDVSRLSEQNLPPESGLPPLPAW